MSLSTKLQKKVLLTKKPTEAILPVLDLLLGLFTVRVMTFQPVVTEVSSFASSSISNSDKMKLKLCENSSLPKQTFYSHEKRIFQLKIGVFSFAK